MTGWLVTSFPGQDTIEVSHSPDTCSVPVSWGKLFKMQILGPSIPRESAPQELEGVAEPFHCQQTPRGVQAPARGPRNSPVD